MLLLLSGVERSVSQLARAVRLSQSCTTRHLQALERAGLVKGVRDGKRVVFRPSPRDATARGVLASLLRNAEDLGGEAAVLAAGIAVGAIPIASAAELEPLTAGVAEATPPVRRVRRVRVRPPREEWGESAPESPAVPEPVPASIRASEPAAGRGFDDAFEPEFAPAFAPGPAPTRGFETDLEPESEPARRRPEPRDEPESGNTSDSYEPPDPTSAGARRSWDIEDFLL